MSARRLTLEQLVKILFTIVTLLSFGHAQQEGATTPIYQEPYRPQLHFSPPQNWINDPNGLIFYEGEYHLFFQHNPFGMEWGNMSWGHAVSRDLLHWENLPVALSPNEHGQIWSGSVVDDKDNTSGLVPGGGLVAVFTYQPQTQGIAYSLDDGRTWTHYQDNPVLPALEKDFRDPKVFWHEETSHWVMAIAAYDEIQFFSSPNLIDWTFLSSFTGGHLKGVWETPDLFPLEFGGETYWVLLVSVGSNAPAKGSGTQYFIGQFDGSSFYSNHPDDILWLDYGPDNYAGQTWKNPEGQQILIGWMNNWRYANETPTSPWRGAMTIPRELSLIQTNDGLRLSQQPIETLGQLRKTTYTLSENIAGEVSLLESGRTYEIIANFELGSAERFGFNLQQNSEEATTITYEVAKETLKVSRETIGVEHFNRSFSAPLTPEDNRVRLHIIVDASSVEIFSGSGETAMTLQSFPAEDATGLTVFADGGSAKVALELYSLKSIWSKQ
jgi:fructan beta-fructosidase